MARRRDPRVQIAPAYQAERRRVRRPNHKFNLKTLPYQLQPFMIAPVLPGETLQNLVLQSRVVSDPLTPMMKLIGWWKEYWFFYVKHRDLDEPYRTQLANMMINPAYDPATSGVRSAADPKYYHYANGVNYTKACLQAVVNEFFRDEGEDWDDFLIDGMPAARIHGRGQNDAWDKLTAASEYQSLGQALPSGPEATVEDLDFAYQNWAAMKDAGLMEMDYEDFIRQYGVQVREEDQSENLHRPELVRYVREWTYPTNVVEPTTGIPATACSWSVAVRGDKRMFFSEPGFLLGVTCARPKIYLANQLGSLAHGLERVQNWLPATQHVRSDIGHIFFDKDGPTPLVGQTEDYWVDVRDLLSFGDQFVNYALDADPGTGGTQLREFFLPLPEADTQRRYADLADVEAMFIEPVDPGDSGIDGTIKEDGMVNLGIIGRQSPNRNQLQLGSGSLVP